MSEVTVPAQDILLRLERWLAAQCNGEWEHAAGVSIQSTDNPGWWVKIDITGTTLASKTFAPVRRGDVDSLNPQPPWMNCFVEEAVFNGAGDPDSLTEILKIFLEWAATGSPAGV